MNGNKKLAWFTALRLDSLSTTELLQLCNKVQAAEASAILLTGNVSASGKAAEDLLMLELYTDIPIYYVMGTTDYEKKSVEKNERKKNCRKTCFEKKILDEKNCRKSFYNIPTDEKFL